MGAAYPANTLKPPTSPFTFQFSVYMYIVSNQVPMMIDVRQNIDTVPMSMLIHPDYRTDKAELFLLSIRMLVLCRQTLDARRQKPAAKCWFPAAGCQLPPKKSHLVFSTKWLFHPLPRQGVDCRGMLSMLSSYPPDSLFPCPSVPSVGGYISLPQSSVGEAECCLCCLLTQLIPCFRVHPCHPWAVISSCR